MRGREISVRRRSLSPAVAAAAAATAATATAAAATTVAATTVVVLRAPPPKGLGFPLARFPSLSHSPIPPLLLLLLLLLYLTLGRRRRSPREAHPFDGGAPSRPRSALSVSGLRLSRGVSRWRAPVLARETLKTEGGRLDRSFRAAPPRLAPTTGRGRQLFSAEPRRSDSHAGVGVVARTKGKRVARGKVVIVLSEGVRYRGRSGGAAPWTCVRRRGRRVVRTEPSFYSPSFALPKFSFSCHRRAS
jgi:MYXO-CTERM domain-containing protein